MTPPNFALESTATPLFRSTVAAIRTRAVRSTLPAGGSGSAWGRWRHDALHDPFTMNCLLKLIQSGLLAGLRLSALGLLVGSEQGYGADGGLLSANNPTVATN